MNYFKIAFFCSFSILASNLLYAQKDSIPLTTILERKAKLTHDYPTEKVHLHFDKPYYAISDTIWFKAYLTIDLNIPSPLSKILYVDLINSRDSLVESLKLPVTNTVSSGSIVLPYEKYKQGTYQLRAYTKWMLNNNQAYFFSKNIYIGNAINKDLSTHISFTGTSTDKANKVNARIQYKDEKGVPLANKKVSWEVVADYERVAKGKGSTDANGYININFTASQKVALNTGQLITSLETDNNRNLSSTFPLKTAILENDIQFFPEGGDLVAGLPSKVAFKALRSDGLGIDVKGEVIDEQGKVIANLTSQHLGMGAFTFLPEANKTYKANITFKDGSEKTFNLPEVKAEGMLVSAEQDAENVEVKISTNPAFIANNQNKGFYIIAQNNGVVFYAAQSVIKNQVYTAKISKEKFPSGILQLTLLSTNGDPISERLIFIKKNDLLDLKVSTDLPAYNSRQKVKLNLIALNPNQIAEGNYSIAVVDETKVPVNEDSETTILSNLLLTSDLEGFIEQPNYYFNKTDDKKLSDLDVLMLTQGYRRFLYKDVVSGIPPKITYFPEQGIDITGTIRKSNGMPLEKGRLLLQIPDKHFSSPILTDQEGRFRFPNLVFQDSSEVIINARNNINSKDLRIMVDGEAYPAIYKNVNSPDEMLNMDSTLNAYLQNSKLQNNNAFMLREVVVKGAAVKKPSHADHSALSGLNMMPDRLTSSEQLQGCAQLINCLSGSGLTYIDNMLYLTRNYQSGVRVPVEVYVNGMPVDVNYLASIDTKGVESIEVFNNDGLSGINRRSNTSGVVVVNMKEVKKVSMTKDQLKALFPDQNILKFTPKGYATERQFYVPKYAGPRTALQPKDIRSTIYWNPIVNTDKEGKASLEFFNADDKGTYRVVVEGLDNNGNIGRAVYKYQVK